MNSSMARKFAIARDNYNEEAPWCPSLVAELQKEPELRMDPELLLDMLDALYIGGEMQTCSVANCEIERE